MSILQKSSKKGSSRQQIDIKGVHENILMLPKNQYRAILEVSPINFELKSEDEQDIIIDTYESFLNSLPCTVQILVRVRELDMSKYLQDVKDQAAAEQDAIYKSQLADYSDFVEDLVTDNKILSRHFYIVLPYAISGKDAFEVAKRQLQLNADMVSGGLKRLGVYTRRLENLEILDLFHSFYNPTDAKERPIAEQVAVLLKNSYVSKEQL